MAAGRRRASRPELLVTAEPFGFGPSSSLAQILAAPPLAGGAARARYLGEGHTLELLAAVPALEGRVEACHLDDEAGARRFRARCAASQALLSVCDFRAAALAQQAGIPTLLYDPLAWYWRRLPAACRGAAVYLCQDFFGVRERLAREGLENAVVVPPLTPTTRAPVDRAGALVSLGGLANPYLESRRLATYAAAVFRAAARALDGREPVTRLTSGAVAAHLPGLEVATLAPGQVHERMASVQVALMTPGLGQIYEAAALGTPVLWLPPANDSQGQQLAHLRRHGMAPGAVDWGDLLGGPGFDYGRDQGLVMRDLGEAMARLGEDLDLQDLLAARLAAGLATLAAAEEAPLGRLVTRFGRGGAAVAAGHLARWLGREPRAAAGGARRRATLGAALERAALPASPWLAPLRLPPGNHAGPEELAALARLHQEVDGTGFHTLAATLALCRRVRAGAERPGPADFAAAREAFDVSGPELLARYRGAHCTALAEVLRLRLQEETGLVGVILCVRHADSSVPLPVAWEDYAGTVHADLLVPYVDRPTGEVRAAHVVTGMGVRGHLHLFSDTRALEEHLRRLGYSLGAVVDPVALTRVAFGYKERLWLVPGPEVDEGAEKLGVDLLRGEVFLNSAAAAHFPGPRAPAAPVVFRLDDPSQRPGCRALLRHAAARYRQPEGFVEEVLFLGDHLDAYVDGVLSAPGPRLRREARGG